MKIQLVLLVMFLISGCAVSGKQTESEVFRSQNILKLDRNFPDLMNASRIYFQNSRKLARSDLDSWQSYCSLFVYKPGETADFKTSVLPGTFDIVRSTTGIETVDLGNMPVLVASLEWARHDPPSYVLYKTTLYLKSSTQPEVQSLDCVQKVSTFGDYHFSESQIIGVLPDYFQFIEE